MATQIQLRRGTAAAWTSANPILAQGEVGWETDTGYRKVGDGTTAWTSLAYSSRLAAEQDVTITSLTNRDALVYDSSSGKWKNVRGSTLVSASALGMVASDPAAPVDISTAFTAAIAALTAGQSIVFDFDPAHVDSFGFTNYCIAAPLCLTKEIGLYTGSKYVRITLVGNAWGFGGTYFHVIRNWGLVESGYTEVIDQAPNVTATPTQHLYVGCLDGDGFAINLNQKNLVSAASFVHLHERSRISVHGYSGSVPGSPFQWGNRVVSLFSNADTTISNGVTAGPIWLSTQQDGQGWDHEIYGNGRNKYTTATGVNALNSATINVASTTGFPSSGTAYLNAIAFTYTGVTATSFTGCGNHAATVGGEIVSPTVKWIQDLRLTRWYSAPVWNSAGTFKNCLKAAVRIDGCNGLITDDGHIECVPYSCPPAAGQGLWQALTAVAVGTRIVVQSNDGGANQGLAALAVCTVAGTTGAAPPTWPSPAGTATVTDASVTWRMQAAGAGNGGNASSGVLDGATAWPGAGITVPLGTTISPDGVHGWVCTTTGVTSGSQPAFSTAGGRGATQTDGSVVWTYVIDDFDQAVFRLTDVANHTIDRMRVSAYGLGSRLPFWKSDTTGGAPVDKQTFQPGLPTIIGLDMEMGGSAFSGLATIDRGGWWGPIFVWSPKGGVGAQTISWSQAFDPQRIEIGHVNRIEYLNAIAKTPSTYYPQGNPLASRLSFKKTSAAFTPSATANTNGTGVDLPLGDTGFVGGIVLQRFYTTSGVSGETLTMNFVTTFSDGSTLTQSTDTTATTSTTTAIGYTSNLAKDGVYATKVTFFVKSSINSSAASVTATVIGINV